MSEFSYPDILEIRPMTSKPQAAVTVPGSKSLTNRALVLAAMWSRYFQHCELEGALQSEDTEVMINCLRRLGFTVETDWPSVFVSRPPGDRIIPAESADLYVANSGTTVRFITALVALGHGTYRLDGVPRMRERPIQDLLDALNQLGADARSDAGTGCPPITIRANGWAGGDVRVRADVSSQFLSGLLMAAAFAGTETHIHIDGGVVSEPYIQMTVDMLGDRTIKVVRQPYGYEVLPKTSRLLIPAIREHSAATSVSHIIEPDASAASYFWALPAILGGRITVTGLSRASVQGDVKFVEVLQQMGCRVEEGGGITVHGGPLKGIDVDMNAISDTVMTLGAVACFADGPTTIRNVAHIRHKETDRIAALATELRRLGAGVDEFADGLTIIPRPLHGAEVETYNDHRMAMSLALVGLKVPGVKIKNPGCVAKTYPGFWQDLDKLR